MASPAAQAELDVLAIYENGGVIPATASSGQVTVTVNADQSHTVSAAGANGTERVHIDWTSPYVYTLTADQNADGVVDETMTSTSSNGITTLVWSIDRLLDGTFNWTDTMTTSSQVITGYIQEIPTGSTTAVATSAYTSTALEPVDCSMVTNCNDPQTLSSPGHTFASAPNLCLPPTPPDPPCATGDECCGMPGVPCGRFDGYSLGWKATSVAPKPFFIGTNQFYAIKQGAMTCTSDQAGQIETVLQSAVVDFPKFVGAINQSLYNQVFNQIANIQIFYGCEIPTAFEGDAVDAVTSAAYFSDEPNVYITTITPNLLVPASAAALEETIVHEWFHAAGLHHQVDNGGSSQRDVIYSCARVANQCQAFSKGYYTGQCCDASSARDGAMCADLTLKSKYGAQELFNETANLEEEEEDGNEVGITNVCTAGTMTANAVCGVEQQWAFCDQTMFTKAQTLMGAPLGYPTQGTQMGQALDEYMCVEECPSTVNQSVVLCGTRTVGTTWPPNDMTTPLVNGPSRFWGSPSFQRNATLPNSGSIFGQTGNDTNCGPVVYPAGTCAY
jgi:hypothetical protein